MGTQWGPVDVIPNSTYSTTTDELSDDIFSDVSQSMDELLDRNNTLDGQENLTSFDSRLDPDALDEMALDEAGLNEMAQDISGNEAFQEADMPGYMAAGGGLLSGAAFGKVRSFILGKLSSMRNMSDDNDGMGLDELLDLDDIRNANWSSATPPVGVESAA
jgi:hypothetical protein